MFGRRCALTFQVETKDSNLSLSASTRAAVNTSINNHYYFSLILVWSARYTQCDTEIIIRDPFTVSFSFSITFARIIILIKRCTSTACTLIPLAITLIIIFSSFVVVYSSSPLLSVPLLPFGSLLLPQRAIIIIMTIVCVTFILFSFVNCCRCRRGTAYNIFCFTMPDLIFVFFSFENQT